jgi:hypothetical protein
LGGWDQEAHSLKPAQAKSSQDHISTKSWSWWYPPVIPATQGAEIGGSQFQARLGKNKIFETLYKQRRLGVVAKTCYQLWQEV